MVINVNSRLTRDQSRQAAFFSKKNDTQRRASSVAVDQSVFAKTPTERELLRLAKQSYNSNKRVATA